MTKKNDVTMDGSDKTEDRHHTRYARLRILVAWLMACCLMVCAAGCQTPKPTTGPLLLFPSPPAQPRVQFLTWFTTADQIEQRRSGFEKFVLGDDPNNLLRIEKPYGLAAHDGVLYVCDTKMPGVCRLDFKNRQFSVMGLSGPGRLRKPVNIAVDELGYKFVVDVLRKQVVVYGPSREVGGAGRIEDPYVTAFTIPQPAKPVDIAVYEDELFVLDNDDTCHIVVLNRSDGRVLRTFGAAGEEEGKFNKPNSIAVSPDGFVYVSDTFNWRIQKLSRDGEVVWSKGAEVPGARLGQFVRPRGLRVGPDGIVYVVDAATEIVQMYNDQGQVLMHFGGPGTLPGAMVLPASIALDASSLPYFQDLIHPDFQADYLLFVSNQYGPRLINVYAFGAFPEGYKLSESVIESLSEPGQGGESGLPDGPEIDVQREPGEQAPPSPKDDQKKKEEEDVPFYLQPEE